MTRREKQCLDAIMALTIDGVGPTLQEIADHIGLKSKSGAHRLIEALHAQGLIDRGPVHMAHHGPRKITVVGAFDRSAIDRMSHADLLALRDQIDRRLAA